uniref:Uncharacterized protein n=1 Tax=viral metagenome TaxID=1070528 RepID=A0A6C0ANQ0_9ZZZZ
MAIIEDVSSGVYKFIKYAMLIGIAFGFTTLFVSSIIVHDTAYIQKNPKFFLGETLFMGVLTTIPVMLISYLRGASKSEIEKGSGLIFLKIVLLHIGFQLSGVYSVIFPKSA